MPVKPQNPESFVKLSPQKSSTEQNKPRKQMKKKSIPIASVEQPASTDDSADRINEPTVKRLPAIYVHEKKIDLLVDGVPYRVHTIPFLWNDSICFRVHINGNEAHVFLWDEEAESLRAIDDASILPDGLESALIEKLKVG